MKNKTLTLDKWDYKIIYALKHRTDTMLSDLKVIWGERCMLPPEYIDEKAILYHLSELVEEFNRISLPSLMINLERYEQFLATANETLTTTEKLIHVLGIHLALANCDTLPGYEEYLKQKES